MFYTKNFSAAGKSLREEIASLTRNLLTKLYEPSLLEPYIEARFITKVQLFAPLVWRVFTQVP